MEWKVPSHVMPSTMPPMSMPIRSFISRAALLVKVTARIWLGQALRSCQHVGEAVVKHAGFASACTCENEQRTVDRQHSIALFGVEAFQVLRVGCRHGTRGMLPPGAGWCRFVVEVSEVDGVTGHSKSQWDRDSFLYPI